MHVEGLNDDNLEPILNKPLSKAKGFPFPPSCDFREITQEMVNTVLAEEIQRVPEFAQRYDEWNTDEQVTRPLTPEEQQIQFRVEGEIELIVLSIGDNTSVKKNIFQFMMQLSKSERTHAINYIKLKASAFVKGIKQEIIDETFKPGLESYYKFLSQLNVNLLMKYPINTDITRHLVEELFRMYLELKSFSDIPNETLQFVHKQIENYISGLGLLIELPAELRESLQNLTESEVAAKPIEQKGENSLASFEIIPSPNEFPDISPFKERALDILEGIRDVVYGSMKRTNSFEQYFNIVAELGYADLDKDSRENIFKHTCSSEKHKIDRISLRLKNLEYKLSEILAELDSKGESYDPKMLPDYIKSVETHIKQMWEKAIFPHLLLYGNLIFGKIPPNKPQWLYLDA